MPVETDADRLALLDADEFGVDATYTPAGGSPSTVRGIFDKEFAAVDVNAGVPVEGRRPVFLARESDLPAVAHGDEFTIAGTDYTAAGVEPDGTGMVRVLLEES